LNALQLQMRITEDFTQLQWTSAYILPNFLEFGFQIVGPFKNRFCSKWQI
jgi:hypothetical protein